MTTTAAYAPRPIAPVKLRDSSAGRWLRTWSNDVDLHLKGDDGFLLRDECGKFMLNPAWLSANVFRSDGKGSRWTIKFFLAGEKDPVYTQDDVWSLRMVRQLLAYLAADWSPQGSDTWYLRRQLEDAVHEAWLEAADREIDRVGGE